MTSKVTKVYISGLRGTMHKILNGGLDCSSLLMEMLQKLPQCLHCFDGFTLAYFVFLEFLVVKVLDLCYYHVAVVWCSEFIVES